VSPHGSPLAAIPVSASTCLSITWSESRTELSPTATIPHFSAATTQVFPPFPSTFPVFRDAAQLERGTDSDDDNPRPVGVLDYHQLLLDLSYSPQFLPPTRSADAYLSKVTRMFPLPTTFPYLSRVKLSCESYVPSRAKYLSTKTCLEPSI
jgi:hypothetical protein